MDFFFFFFFWVRFWRPFVYVKWGLKDWDPVQYLGYCTVCNWFNFSHSIDLMLKNWTTHLDKSVIRVSSHFSLLFQFLLSLLHAYPYSKISETLSLSSSRTCLRISLSCLKKSHQWCFGYLSTEEWMWTNSVSATHPNVIRSGNQIYEFFFSLCDFFAKDHPFVSFIARKIIYFFHCIFLFIYKFD